MQKLTIVPHPDGSGDAMVVLPDDVWARAQQSGWREGDRYFISPVEDGVQLTRLVPEELRPAAVLCKSRFKRELNRHLRAVKDGGIVEVAPGYVVVRAALFDGLVDSLSDADAESGWGQNSREVNE